MCFKFSQQCWNSVVIQIVIGQMGRYVYLFEEMVGGGNGGINMFVVGIVGDILYMFSVLQEFCMFNVLFFVLQCRQNDSQCLGMIEIVYCGKFVVQYMCCLVLWNFSVNQVI